MIFDLQKINLFILEKMDNPVLLRQPARPGPVNQVAQRFQPANTLERFAQDGFDHIKMVRMVL
jgi:hypothetical protein